MGSVGVKDASYVETFLVYHTWVPVSQMSVYCFLPFSHSLLQAEMGGFWWTLSHTWNWAMKNEIFKWCQAVNCPLLHTVWVAPGCTGMNFSVMLFAGNLCQGQGKVSLQMEQPVSGVTALGDTPHHQLFASCRAHAVTWHTNATPGLWSAFPSTKFEGVQWTF